MTTRAQERAQKKEEPNKVPFPKTLPGKFIVIEYVRDESSYTILLDDKDQTSYILGHADQMNGILNRFEQWGIKKLGSETLDMARTFGACQGIFADGRTISLHERKNVRALRWEHDEPAGTYLPALRG